MSEAAATKEFTVDDIKKEIKPLSENGFIRFWQKIWRWWLGVWYTFAEKHPKLAALIKMAFFFIVFSEGVTILQFIIMTFLPFAFKGMWDQPFVWPAVALPWTDAAGNPLNYAIFNEPVKYLVNMQNDDGTWKVATLLASSKEQLTGFVTLYGDTYQNVNKAGELVGGNINSLQASGLGNFIAFEIAVFIAQCINFPLQRNITYRSHGNPWIQGMWYFIGWLGVSIATNAIWGICNPLLMHWDVNEVLIGLIKTVLTGGVSLVVFFFIFMVIFPDNNKMAKKAKAKYEKLVAANAPAEKIAAAEAKMNLWEDKALKSNTEKELVQAKSLVNTKSLRYFALVKASEKANAQAEEAEKLLATDTSDKAKAKAEKAKAAAAVYPEKLEKAFAEAGEAITTRDEKQAAYDAAHEEAAAEPTPEATA